MQWCLNPGCQLPEVIGDGKREEDADGTYSM